ncbi:MAG: sulfate adenylyltransferase subunit CysN [Gammaproteobacteria bacterium]|nr:MAG: sulfate adenylyltransferase subunit CysN [Gammaproteobacteria bacterium]
MSHVHDDLIALDIDDYLARHERKELLRFITCGSVDDGKSTLIGRLLFDSKMLFEDQLATIERDSKKWGTQAEAIDLALLVDGLAAEREQGITIDVAYRYFATDARKFIVADTPGHEQYTRNMVTGASTADAAILLIDARRGVLTQTRRHGYLAHLLGIRHLVLAINKMDLMEYAESVYDQIVADFQAFAGMIGISAFTAIPVSALTGDNVTEPSAHMGWYTGPSLLKLLEMVEVDASRMLRAPFRMPVQWVNRPNAEFRGFCGSIVSGAVAPGERVRILPSGKESRIARIVTDEGDLPRAQAGQSVTLTLTDEVDISRGGVIVTADAPAEVADQFEARIVWMQDDPLFPGRNYLFKAGTSTVVGTVTAIKYQVNVNTLEHLAADKLELNGIGVCNISLDRPIAFDPYDANREMGSFILIDRMTHQTCGAGMLNFALRRAHNIHQQHVDVDKASRAVMKGHRAGMVWFTGLSGSGKSTVANLLEKRLHALGVHTYLLDGDNVRHGLNRDLGFTEADRVENIRRVAEVGKLMVDAGLLVLTAFISPFRSERQLARELLDEGEFIEVYMNTPLDVAEARDPKGLYKKARRGELKNFTGIDSPYEAPESAEIELDTSKVSPEEAADHLLATLRELGMIR